MRSALALALCLGCGPESPGGGGLRSGTDTATGLPGSTPSTGTTPTTTGSSSSSTTGWGWTTPPWEQPVDCGAALPLPLGSTTYTFVPSHEDFTFSADGRWVGTAGNNLHATPWGGPSTVVIPGVGGARGTRFLPDQTLVMASTSDGSIVQADPATGAHWTLVSGLNNPNGIAIGLDGKAYVATTGEILRVDPSDASIEVVASIPGRSFDGLSFSPDYTRLYFNEEIGRLHFVDFDEEGNPGPVVDAGSLPIGVFSLLDGMTVDACGNLWAVEMGGKVWRVSVDGTMELAVDLPVGAFVPALNFGPGVGGFERDRLYVQDFIGKMYEIEVGVPGKWEPHLPWD